LSILNMNRKRKKIMKIGLTAVFAGWFALLFITAFLPGTAMAGGVGDVVTEVANSNFSSASFQFGNEEKTGYDFKMHIGGGGFGEGVAGVSVLGPVKGSEINILLDYVDSVAQHTSIQTTRMKGCEVREYTMENGAGIGVVLPDYFITVEIYKTGNSTATDWAAGKKIAQQTLDGMERAGLLSQAAPDIESGKPDKPKPAEKVPAASAIVTGNPLDEPIRIADTTNIMAVYNGPTAPTTLSINTPHLVTEIHDYHWNNAQGANPGTIGLQDQNGKIYGPWQAVGTPGQGGVPNANWFVYPNIVIPAGTYTVIDSDPSTWSQNTDSGGKGMGYVLATPHFETTSGSVDDLNKGTPGSTPAGSGWTESPAGVGSVGNIPGPSNTTEAVTGVAVPGLISIGLGALAGLGGGGGFTPSGGVPLSPSGGGPSPTGGIPGATPRSGAAQEIGQLGKRRREEIFIDTVDMQQQAIDVRDAGPVTDHGIIIDTADMFETPIAVQPESGIIIDTADEAAIFVQPEPGIHIDAIDMHEGASLSPEPEIRIDTTDMFETPIAIQPDSGIIIDTADEAAIFVQPEPGIHIDAIDMHEGASLRPEPEIRIDTTEMFEGNMAQGTVPDKDIYIETEAEAGLFVQPEIDKQGIDIRETVPGGEQEFVVASSGEPGVAAQAEAGIIIETADEAAVIKPDSGIMKDESGSEVLLDSSELEGEAPAGSETVGADREIAQGSETGASISKEQRVFDQEGFDAEGFDRDGFNRQGFNAEGFNKDGFDKTGFDREGFDQDGFNRDGFSTEGLDKAGFDKEGFNKAGFDKEGFNREGYNSEGYDKAGYDREGYDREGLNQADFDRDGYNSQGFDQDGFNRDGFDRDGFDKAGFNAEGFDKEGFNKAGFNSEGYNREGFDQAGFDKEGFDQAGFDKEGFDKAGFNAEGFDKAGFNKEGYNREGFNQAGFDKEGFDKAGFDKEGFNKAGFNAEGFNKDGFDKAGFDKAGFDKDGFNREGFDQAGFDKEGFNKAGFNQEGFNREGFDKAGFDKEGYNKAGFNSEGYNREGFDQAGFDKEGFDKTGFDKTGFDKEGFNKAGFDKEGYNREGFNQAGFDKEGFNREGFDKTGFDREGFDKNGFDAKGFDREGFNKAGFDKEGYGRNGFDSEGFDREGYDVNGYNAKGYNRSGYNAEGYNAAGYDKEGFNKDGWDKEGYGRDGLNKQGFDREGYDKNGYDAEGYNRDGYNREGQSKEGYDADGYDKKGFNEHGYDRDGYDREGFDFEGYNRGGRDPWGFDRQGYGKDGYHWSGYNADGYDRSGLHWSENPYGEGSPFDVDTRNPFDGGIVDLGGQKEAWKPTKPPLGQPFHRTVEKYGAKPWDDEIPAPKPEKPTIPSTEDSGVIGPEDPMNTLKNHGLDKDAPTAPEGQSGTSISIPEEDVPEAGYIPGDDMSGSEAMDNIPGDKPGIPDSNTFDYTDPVTGETSTYEYEPGYNGPHHGDRQILQGSGDGQTYEIEFDAVKGKWINSESGNEFDPERFESWQRDVAEDRRRAAIDLEKMARGEDANSKAIKKNLEDWRKLEQMQKAADKYNIGEPGGPGDVDKAIQNLKDDMLAGKQLDQEKMDKIRRVIDNRILGKTTADTGERWNEDWFKNLGWALEANAATAKEVITGEKADGSTSYLGMGARLMITAATAGLAGGASLTYTVMDGALNVAEAMYRIQDEIAKGGSDFKAVSKAIGLFVLGEEMSYLAGAAGGSIMGEMMERFPAFTNKAADLIETALLKISAKNQMWSKALGMVSKESAEESLDQINKRLVDIGSDQAVKNIVDSGRLDYGLSLANSFDDVSKGPGKAFTGGGDDILRGTGKSASEGWSDIAEGGGKAAVSSSDDIAKGGGKAAVSSSDDIAKGGGKAAVSSSDDIAKGGGKAATSSSDDIAKGGGKAAVSSSDDIAKGGGKATVSSSDDIAKGGGKAATSSSDDMVKGKTAGDGIKTADGADAPPKSAAAGGDGPDGPARTGDGGDGPDGPARTGDGGGDGPGEPGGPPSRGGDGGVPDGNGENLPLNRGGRTPEEVLSDPAAVGRAERTVQENIKDFDNLPPARREELIREQAIYDEYKTQAEERVWNLTEKAQRGEPLTVEDIMEMKSDPASMRTLKNLREVDGLGSQLTQQEAEGIQREFNNVMDEYVHQPSYRTVEDHLHNRYPGVDPEGIRVRTVRTPGTEPADFNINTDNDVIAERLVRGPNGPEWVEIPKAEWEDTYYKALAENSGFSVDVASRRFPQTDWANMDEAAQVRQWAKHHEEAAMDQFDLSAGRDFSDQRTWRIPDGDLPGRPMIEATPEEIARGVDTVMIDGKPMRPSTGYELVQRQQGSLLDSEQLSLMESHKVDEYWNAGSTPAEVMRNQTEAMEQLRKTACVAETVESSYRGMGYRVEQMPENMQEAIKVINNNSLSPAARAARLQELGYETPGDFLNKVTSRIGAIRTAQR